MWSNVEMCLLGKFMLSILFYVFLKEEGFVLTPVRLTIPDTPPSMREKLKQLRLAKAGESDYLYIIFFEVQMFEIMKK